MDLISCVIPDPETPDYYRPSIVVEANPQMKQRIKFSWGELIWFQGPRKAGMYMHFYILPLTGLITTLGAVQHVRPNMVIVNVLINGSNLLRDFEETCNLQNEDTVEVFWRPAPGKVYTDKIIAQY